ncbi:unnamed protein product [Oppiella nova]|uniref:Uncharacterized protein n=1 Tax=Oppiella nova TaxID=334625 RepID=A0A7R9MAK7_9ACAR|nr:unnamed protein product [Oppiella nova]CAG2172569.1 unnamed protein product [Oppiella nova]
MSRILVVNTMASLGYLIGSLVGFLYKYINRQMTLIVMTTILGIFTALMPFCTNVYLLYIRCGGWDSSNAVWVFEMWKDKSPPVLQLSQMMFGLGAILAPILARPFVRGDISNTTTATVPPFGTTVPSVDENINYSFDRRPELEIPYMISGGFTLIITKFIQFNKT